MLDSQENNDPLQIERMFVDFAAAALEHITAHLKANEIPIKLLSQIIFQSNTSCTQSNTLQTDYQQLWIRFKKQIFSLDITQQCISVHEKTNIIKLFPRGDSHSSEFTPDQRGQILEYLWAPIMDALHRHNTLSLTHEQLQQSYRRFLEAWTATAVRQDSMIPLLNFHANIASLPTHISKHYQLAPFLPEEKTLFWSVVESFRTWDLLPFYSFLAAEFKLQGSRSHPKIQANATEQNFAEFSRSHRNMLNEIRNIVTALRLLKAGDVAVTAYIEQSNEIPLSGGYPSMGIPGTILSDFQVRRHNSSTPYILQEADFPFVQSLIEMLYQLDMQENRGGLEIALRRFNQSYSREFYEDRLIDLTIALESCLLAGLDSKTELKYRFTLRGAVLLANNRNPQETIRQLSAMYDVRSAIVHEGKHLTQQKPQRLLGQEPKAFIQICEDLTRMILRAYLKSLTMTQAKDQGNVKSINQGLEQRMLAGLSTTEE